MTNFVLSGLPLPYWAGAKVNIMGSHIMQPQLVVLPPLLQGLHSADIQAMLMQQILWLLSYMCS